MRYVWKKFYVIFILLMTVFLSGCSYFQQHFFSLNKAPGATHKKHPATPALVALHDLGFHYQWVNSHLIVLMPVDEFFEKDTIHLKDGYDQRMQKVALLLHSYARHHVVHAVRLVGVPATSSRHKLLLTHQYALIVAGYLWKTGVPLRIASDLKNRHDQNWVNAMLPRIRAHRGVVLEVS